VAGHLSTAVFRQLQPGSLVLYISTYNNSGEVRKDVQNRMKFVSFRRFTGNDDVTAVSSMVGYRKLREDMISACNVPVLLFINMRQY
jgi:hypothetical protein